MLLLIPCRPKWFLFPGLLSVLLITGCASIDTALLAASWPRNVQRPALSLETPEVASKPSSRWADLSLAGRKAMKPDHYREAEYHFGRALESLRRVSKHDARVAATLGNLVQLAAIHERLDRRGDAERVMARVMMYADSRGMTKYRALRYDSRYHDLVAQPLGRTSQPLMDREPYDLADLDRMIVRTAHRFSVDPALVKAVVAAESNFEPHAVSHAGAQGLMQLMPATAKEMGVNKPFKPSENLKGGVRYLRMMLDRFGEVPQAVAAYNAGPHAVDQYGGIPPYPETQQYVQRVLNLYRDYSDETAP